MLVTLGTTFGTFCSLSKQPDTSNKVSIFQTFYYVATFEIYMAWTNLGHDLEILCSIHFKKKISEGKIYLAKPGVPFPGSFGTLEPITTSFLVPWWRVFNHVIPTLIVSVPFVIVFITIFFQIQRLQVFEGVIKATKATIKQEFWLVKLSSYAGWSSSNDRSVQYVGASERFRIRGTVKASAEYSIEITYMITNTKSSDLIAEPSPLRLMASSTLKAPFIY